MTNKTKPHMETNPTPGPWTVVEDIDGSDRIMSTAVFDGPKTVVSPSQGICGCSVAQAIANARLIAQAPDLLEAATAYLAVIQGDDSPEANALRAAITRATGD